MAAAMKSNLERLAELERRYSGPIPRLLLEPIMLNASPREIALVRAIAELDAWRHSLNHPSLSESERMQCRRYIAKLEGWIAELEEQTDA